MTTQKILMLRGLPASGKSTFAKGLVANDNSWVRVNADDIRIQYFKDIPFSNGREKQVFAEESQQILDALVMRKNVVVDDTNLSPKQLVRIQGIIKKFEEPVTIEWKEFNDIPLPELIERDSKRGDAKVGAGVIRRMWRQYFTPLVPVWDENKKRAYIVDLDGTLCLFGGDASPYDREFSQDKPNIPLIDILWSIKTRYHDNVDILYTSGRFARFYEVTVKWIFDNNIPTGKLFMRPDNDKRHDYEYKLERYRNDIEPFYNIAGVFDDRNQVVDLWRWLGLPTFQVNYGDF